MRILFTNRNPDAWLGGDVLKMMNFKKHIETLGHEVVFSFMLNEDFSQFDIVHTFGINFPWAYQTYVQASMHNKKLVVSSIFFDTVGSKAQVKEIIDYASAIVVFSDKERDKIKETIGLPDSYDGKFFNIFNGVDKVFYSENKKRDIDVLCVGSFHPRKQQKLVCEICEDMGIVPHFVGTQHDQQYYQRCTKYKFEYHGRMEQNDLIKLYERTKVVVQPSIIDPFPNTLLEGGMAGCNIVCTNNNYIPEDVPNIFYCDPHTKDSVTKAISDALITDPTPELREFLNSKYSWDIAARKKIKLYKKLCLNE